ncbi:hypothetical protein Bca101_079379 [Brassica carinata]
MGLILVFTTFVTCVDFGVIDRFRVKGFPLVIKNIWRVNGWIRSYDTFMTILASDHIIGRNHNIIIQQKPCYFSADKRELLNVKVDAKKSKKKGNKAPVPSWLINGAWQETSKAGGMGWIIKTAAGEVLCRGSSNRSHVCSALMAEALALREALKKAQELNLQSLQVFSDSQVLVSTLDAGMDLNEIAGVLQVVKSLATLFCPLSVVFIPHVENSQADTLAKSSISRLLNVV